MTPSKDNDLGKRLRQNMKLLITIIFTLLLAIAFYANYDIEVQKSSSGKPPSEINLMIRLIFLSGIFSIIISFIAYTSCRKELEILAYLFSLPFALILTYIFTGNFRFLLEEVIGKFFYQYKLSWLILVLTVVLIILIFIKIKKLIIKKYYIRRDRNIEAFSL